MTMRTKAKTELLGVLCLVALLAAPSPAAGQEQTDDRPPHACWRGRPLPACAGFFLLEQQLSHPLTPGIREVRIGQQRPSQQVTFTTRMDWNLGYMVNVAPEWALGGTLTMRFGALGPLTGISARARRWLRDDLSFEFGAGALRTDSRVPMRPQLWGGAADVRINWADNASLFVQWHGVRVPASENVAAGGKYAGFEQTFSVGAGAGSTWAVVGSALTLALAKFYAYMLEGSS